MVVHREDEGDDGLGRSLSNSRLAYQHAASSLLSYVKGLMESPRGEIRSPYADGLTGGAYVECMKELREISVVLLVI